MECQNVPRPVVTGHWRGHGAGVARAWPVTPGARGVWWPPAAPAPAARSLRITG
eukprot:gene22507-biopygen16256